MVDAHVREQIEELRRQKTSHSRERMSRLAWERYSEIKKELEADHHGSFVMIEVDSGDYFVGSTSQDALQHALERYPQKAFYLIRIGYRAAGNLRAHRSSCRISMKSDSNWQTVRIPKKTSIGVEFYSTASYRKQKSS